MLLGKLRPSWFYSWSHSPTGDNDDRRESTSTHSAGSGSGSTGCMSSASNAAEFVPMLWSARNAENETILAELRRQPPKHLLGFNEPDLDSQASMSVEAAIALWPSLESIGPNVRLGSPTTSAPLNAWMTDFMSIILVCVLVVVVGPWDCLQHVHVEQA